MGIETTHEEREAEAASILDENEIIVSDSHFVYAAGAHGDAYVQKDKTIKVPRVLKAITRLMAEDLADGTEVDEIDYLVGFAPCSSVLASRMAEHLGEITGHTPNVAFLEKVPFLDTGSDGKLQISYEHRFKRGFDKELRGKRIWEVEDVVTTGKTLIEGRERIQEIEGAELLGASAEYSRNPGEVNAQTLGLDVWQPLIEKALNQYDADECPMCEDLDAYPIRTDLGHGAEYLAAQRQS